MKTILTLLGIFLSSIIFSQNLEVEGKVKIDQMDQDNSRDSVVVWLADSTLGIREVSSLSNYISDTDQDTRIEVEATSDDDIIRFTVRDSQIMLIDSSGRIGIGDSMPLEAFHLKGGNFLQTPCQPILTGSLGIGNTPSSVYVSGSYAYVVDWASNDLKVIDVTVPGAPAVTGSLGIGNSPNSVFISGRYAYVVDEVSDDLKVIDVSDPSAPSLAGSLTIGDNPNSVYISGHYAYVVDGGSDDLKVINIADPMAPSLTGSLSIGTSPFSVFVSGRYAYVTDIASTDLKVIDVSDPSTPTLTGSVAAGYPSSVYVSGRYAYVIDFISGELNIFDVSVPSAPVFTGSVGIGSNLSSIYVSGSYAYVVDQGSNGLKVIDVSDPSTPTLAGSLSIGDYPNSVFVSGRYAYVVDIGSADLKIIDVSGAEVTSMRAYSLEAGNLQVRNDIIAQGQLQVAGGITAGSGGIFSDGNVGVSGSLALANDIAPSSSPDNLVQLYSEDESGSSELKVRDEAGNITTLSPHNFSLVGKRSEPLAWSFYSENEKGKINVDMLKTVRLVEAMSGEQLVHIKYVNGYADVDHRPAKGLKKEIDQLRQENMELKRELAKIKQRLGID